MGIKDRSADLFIKHFHKHSEGDWNVLPKKYILNIIREAYKCGFDDGVRCIYTPCFSENKITSDRVE